MTLTLRRVLAGPATVATFLFLVVPFGLGWLKTALFSPLALPGYIIYAIGSAVGHRLAPQFELWVYWIPFVAGCYGISVVVGTVYEWARAAISQ
ncbi:hypothetical protein ACFQS4_21950 [Saliphagus sp. GCM10025317]